MDYSNHVIRLVKPMHEIDIDRIFPRPFSKRKDAFRLIVDGMTVGAWRKKVAEAGLKKVNVSFITGCYAKEDRNRLEPILVELKIPPA